MIRNFSVEVISLRLPLINDCLFFLLGNIMVKASFWDILFLRDFYGFTYMKKFLQTFHTKIIPRMMGEFFLKIVA